MLERSANASKVASDARATDTLKKFLALKKGRTRNLLSLRAVRMMSGLCHFKEMSCKPSFSSGKFLHDRQACQHARRNRGRTHDSAGLSQHCASKHIYSIFNFMRALNFISPVGMQAVLLMVLFLAFSPATVRAQSTPAPVTGQAPPRIEDGFTFEQIFQLAMRDNLQIKAVRLRRAVAETNILIAGQRPNPDFITSYTRSEPRLNFSVSQPVELGGKRGLRLEVARGEVQLAQLELETALRTLRHDTRIAYFNLTLARTTFALGRESVEQAQKLADVALTRFETGDIAQFEVLQAQLAVARATNEAARLGNGERVARAGLNLLLNRLPDAPLDLQESLLIERTPINTPLLVERALSENVELRAAEEQIKTERSRLRLARAGRVPDLLLEPGIEAIDESLPGKYGFKMQVTVPLPVFNRSRGEIARSNALIEQLLAERDAARQRLASEIGQDTLRLESAREQVDFYETRLLPDADRVRGMAEESYRAGQTGILPVIDAQRSAREVRQGYLQSLFDYQAALADLEAAAGMNLR
jgi:cobalt-zinc-cadmium efflux system outer membrane protein